MQFIKTAIKFDDYPNYSKGELGLTEVAVVGRSNVGKSSLLNHLFQKKKLVKVSSTPGKTQALNFFLIDDCLSFVDLPGYGFAKVPLSVRKEWGPMIQAYLERRKSLSLILFLFDIRRIPNKEDLQFLEWVSYKKIPFIFVLTKSDKTTTKEKRENTKKILDVIGKKDIDVIHYSVKKKIGRIELIRKLENFLS